MNLVNFPDVQTLHLMPSAGGSAQLNTNVPNIENKTHHSEQAGHFYLAFSVSASFKHCNNSRHSSIHTYLVPQLQLPPVICFFLYICEYAKLLWSSLIFQANKVGTKELLSNDFRTHTSSAGEIENKLLTDKHTTIWLTIFPTNMECQIKAVMYADEIGQYAATLKLLNTYLISTARVKVSPISYGKPIHQFYWILHKETVIEQIKTSNEVEKPLPPPTKLNITSFDRIPHLMVDSAAEIDILAIVFRCGPQKNAGRSHHRCQEITLCDNQKNQFLFTLWEDFGEIEGHEISSKMATETDLLVILGRSIGISTYQGLSLQTRYNSTVRVNPNYPQAVALLNWVKENKTMLLSSSSDKTSTSSSIAPMIVTPAGQQLISIAEISSAPSMGVFYVKAEMAILDEFQDFCVLECSGCKQKKRTKDRKDFKCPKCNRKTSLVPRTNTLPHMLYSKLFVLTCYIYNDNHVHEMLSNKVFEIQLRKSSWGSSNTTNATLSILSYMEKQHTPQSTTDRTSKKIKPLEISEVK
ncbi:hypothetical protein MTR67_046041 [Solanum verrucosum]|uniref:Uncharacterized protein n=1 Tax=Solanum verrucosum TaxID=315347 RepID=A0AAF0UWM7_SOLVR|nr:hypothetical protein MTR67_046041 [Solanum verrucosum]